MSLRATVATAGRVLTQVRHDHRTVALLLVVPSLLVGLLAWVLDETPYFATAGPALLGLFPFIVMFVVTSVTTLRERRSGTLERLLVSPLGRGDLIGGYAVAFGLLAALQAAITVTAAVALFGLEVDGPLWLLVLAAVLNGLLGTMLGLLASAFARTEFQVVQFMPAVVFPQLLLGGVIIPREAMPEVLEAISAWLPLSHAIQGLQEVAGHADGGAVGRELAIVGAWALAALVLAALTLRRRTA